MNILMRHDERYRWSQAYHEDHPEGHRVAFADEHAASLRYVQTHTYDAACTREGMPNSWNSYTIEYRVRDKKRFMTQVLRYGIQYTIC